MPGVRDWFNTALSQQLFPTLSALFPSLLPDASALRAHSVAVLKYNASHPRTDVHVDDALFSFTIALSPPHAFEGGVLSCEDAVSVGSMLGVELSFVLGRRGTFGRIGTESSHYLRHLLEYRGQKNQGPRSKFASARRTAPS
jgi:hypothetical protein